MSFESLLFAGRAGAAAACLLAALAAGTARAQQDGAEPGAEAGVIELDPLVVQGDGESARGPVDGYAARRSATGTKTDSSILETPQSISVVTRDQMDARGVLSVGQALTYSAGVLGQPFGSDARFDAPYIRGFSAAESQYLNGLRLVRNLGSTSIEPYGLERVEVLRGPASVLYGQANPGGLVNLVSKRPTWERFGEVVAEGGSFRRAQGAFDFGGPLGEESNLAFRLTGLVRNSGTQMDRVDDDRYFLAPSFAWRPSEDTTITVFSQIQHDRSLSPIGLPLQGTIYGNPNGQLPRDLYLGDAGFDESKRTLGSLGYEFEHRFRESWTFRQNARYDHLKWNYQNLYFSGLDPDMRTAYRGTSIQEEEMDTLSLDNQVEGSFRTGVVGHRLLLGADLRAHYADTDVAFGTAPAIDIYNPDNRQPFNTAIFWSQRTRSELFQAGLYAQNQMDYRNWRLTLGLRHDWAGSNSETGAGTTRQNDSAFSGRAGLTYLFDNGLAPYVSYATSFDPVVGNEAPARGGGAFEPSRGEQYEVGLKYQPPGSRSLFTATAFDLRQSNVAVSDPANVGFQLQTGKIRVRGFELEGVANLHSGLNLISSYTYSDAEILRGEPGERGNRPALVPRHAASLWLDYAFQENSRLSGFGLGGGVRYVGQRYGDTANGINLHSHTLYDAALRYDLGNFRFSLNLNNLLDDTYVATCSAFGCYYGDGRTVLARVAYRW